MFHVRYLHPQPLFRTAGLSIRGIGIRETMPPFSVQRPEGTGDFLFMAFHTPVRWGPTSLSRWIPAGSIVLWERAAAHFYGNPQRPWSHSWIHCDGALVGRTLCSARVPTGQPFPLSDPSRLDHHLCDLHEEITEYLRPDTQIVQNLLVNLIRDVARSNQRRKPLAPPPLRQAKALIDARYHEPLSLPVLAQTAGWSLPYFCSEFHRHFGVPPMAYVIQRRLHTAATLLRETTLGVGEIGRRVGYPDPYYFSKHFKACFGVPPSHLRARNGVSPPQPSGNAFRDRVSTSSSME